MAQTQRSISDIWTLLADNATQDISAQDIRDAFETYRMRHGQLYVAAGAGSALSLPDTGTYYEETVSTWTNDTGAAYEFDESAGNGRLTYTGTQPIMVHIAASISFTLGGSNAVIHCRIGKSGTTIAPSEIQRKVGSGSDVGSTALHLVTSMTNGQYLSLWFRNETDTSALTLACANLQVVSMPS